MNTPVSLRISTVAMDNIDSIIISIINKFASSNQSYCVIHNVDTTLWSILKKLKPKLTLKCCHNISSQRDVYTADKEAKVTKCC